MKTFLQILHFDANRGLLLRTKIPALGLPFSIAANRLFDLSFRLTSSSFGSGIAAFESPADSRLVLSARFDLACPGSAPVFSLHLCPRFGHFSLKRFLLSSSPSQNAGAGDDDELISGISALSRSEVFVGKSAPVRLRWAVNFPTDLDKGVPFLTLDKLSVERLEDAIVPAAESAIAREAVEGMDRDAEGMKMENTSMKLPVGELKSAARARIRRRRRRRTWRGGGRR